MDKKVTGIIAYIHIIGWLIAYIFGQKEEAKFHLTQALTLDIIWLILDVVLGILAAVLSFVPIVGGIITALLGILNVFPFILMIIGIIHAANDEDKKLPIIGGIQLIKL